MSKISLEVASLATDHSPPNNLQTPYDQDAAFSPLVSVNSSGRDRSAAAAAQNADVENRNALIGETTALQAWVQVVLAHLINFNSFGYILSFGLYYSHSYIWVLS
jgi:hypothetical protein